MLAVIWWMYDGYAWLTNAIATDLLRFRLLLLGGMGGFLVIALAIPNAYEGEGLAFGIGYARRRPPPRGHVREGHVRLGGRGDPAHRPVQPHRRCARARRRDRGRASRRRSSGLGAALLLWFTPWFTSTEGFVIAAAHFVERHGLVIIVALGESIVVIGAGAVGRRSSISDRRWSRCSRSRSARPRGGCTSATRSAVERAMVGARRSASRPARARRLRLLALRAAPRRRRRSPPA